MYKMNANIPRLLANIFKTNANTPGLSSFSKLANLCNMNAILS